MNIATLDEGRFVSSVEGQNVSGLLSDRVIVRKIDKINIVDLPALVEVLRFRTSVLNPDDGTAHYSVTDPKVNGVVQTGTWRNVSVKSVEGVHSPGQTTNPAGTIVQELRYGWATAIDWTEARLGKSHKITSLESNILASPWPSNAKQIAVQFVNLDSTKLDAMSTSLNVPTFDLTALKVTINGEAYTGTWYNAGVTSGLANDGSGVITLQLIEIHVQVREFIAQESELETVYHSEEQHDPLPPDITKFVNANGVTKTVVLGGTDAATAANSVHILSHDLDEFLTHNYKKARVVRTPPIPFGTEKTWKVWRWTDSATSQTFSVTLQRWWVSQWILYHNYDEISLRYFRTMDEAIAYITSDTGAESGARIDTTESGWHQTGDYEYEGRKVRHKKHTLTTSTYLEPTS